MPTRFNAAMSTIFCFKIEFCVLGKDAENSFKNLRNRYSRDKKKIKAAKVSGTDTDSVTEVKK